MINSLCGCMGTLKRENSCSKLQPTSPTASVSESNNIATASELDQNNLTPSSLNFQGLKFEVDADVGVQSPDSSIWESLFADQIDSGADFMISSPNRTLPSANVSVSNHNYNYVQAMQGQSLLGCSPPSCNSSLIGAFSSSQKGKAQSPLQKVFNSPANQFMQPESLSLPAIDGFLGGCHRHGFGASPTMKMSGDGCSPESFEMPTTLPGMLDCLPQQNSWRFCGSMNEVSTPGGGSQITQERDMYQMSSFETAPLLSQQQQQLQPPQNIDHGLMVPLSIGSEQEQDSGLQLVHLLLACAEAVAKEHYMLARRYLHHLNRVVTPIGDSMQRVASCFTEALSERLATIPTTTTNPSTSIPKPFCPFPANSLEILKIYQILYQACPYVKFAHFTANQAIFEAFEAEECVHVIDLDILQGYQWPSFMQALAARPTGAPLLRITGVGSPLETVKETGRCLTELAHSLHIPFEFHPIGERLEDLKPHMFNRRVGEALAVNSVNRLHRVAGNYLGNLLGMIRDQAPNIVTLVEQEASHNGPYFLGRFLEALHYYSAIFDSLDATFPADSAERAKVEQYIFAPEIRNIVACEGTERLERHERLEKWRKLMEGKGFKGVPLSANAVTQSKILLGLYTCDGYRLTEDNGCLLLGWQDRALIAASAWRC
ncbi:hypothetical protein HHK36_025221 [Tetracentron sinense]|uniref:Uncharacterized protein n=1 Tax=Tetracentron sinense TaxID=13715 RepID=A0A835D894_TETSI|nr:hypothetical protein HHK36_025221 [Tetracentron sinense]